MHQAIESVPLLADLHEEVVDLLVVLHVTGEQQRAVEVCRKLGNALLKTVVDVGECKLRTLAVHGFGDPVSNRTVAQQSGDEDPFTGEEAHGSKTPYVRIRRL
ncbi:hypothetical protein SDC9_211403 [bioreactor metagenome]|uniref:Uncharacterized protein n=1 Tax=bioreactor metagenome TaxID=1076179 RepID=A0A645JIX3_9ZZZZ